MIRLSHTIDNATPTYGNRNHIIIKQLTNKVENFYVTESQWIFETNHLGTHIDLPKHFINNGLTFNDFNDTFWYFKQVKILDIPKVKGELIQYSEIEEKMKSEEKDKIELLLLRTGYEKYRGNEKYWKDNPGISSHCSKLLKENFPLLKGIGFDFISLTSYNFRADGKIAHHNLFKNNFPFIIIEDMKLSLVKNIENVFVAPLMVNNSDGAPVTVFANL
jgi:kynurenine formamidase